MPAKVKYEVIEAIIKKFYATCPREEAKSVAFGILISIMAVVCMESGDADG